MTTETQHIARSCPAARTHHHYLATRSTAQLCQSPHRMAFLCSVPLLVLWQP